MSNKKYICFKKKIILFGEYYKRPVSSVPTEYLYWMLSNLNLSISQQEIIDKVLIDRLN